MRFLVSSVVLACWLGGTLGTPWGSAAEPGTGSLRDELLGHAKQIVQKLDDIGRDGLEVGEIVPLGESDANGGPGLRLELIAALEQARKGVVRKGANVALQGSYALIDDSADAAAPPDRRLKMELVKLQLIDKTNLDILGHFSVQVRRLRDIALLEGIPARIDPEADSRRQNNQLRAAKEKPTPALAATRILSHSQGRVALEIGVRGNVAAAAQTRAPRLEAGLPFVSIGRDELYELTLHNGEPFEIAVAVAIDGLDVFTFSDDRNDQGVPRFTHFVIAAGGRLVVPGWHKTNDPKRSDNFLSFKVTEYGGGAASQFPKPSQGKVGVIVVAVSRSHLPGSGGAKSTAETGFGPPVKADVKSVIRLIDPPHEFLTVRYAR